MARGFTFATLAVTVSLPLLAAGSAFAVTTTRYFAGTEGKEPSVVARDTALRVDPGKIVSEKLEKASNGTDRRYSFVISNNGSDRNVVIDATDGQVVANKAESAASD